MNKKTFLDYKSERSNKHEKKALRPCKLTRLSSVIVNINHFHCNVFIVTVIVRPDEQMLPTDQSFCVVYQQIFFLIKLKLKLFEV